MKKRITTKQILTHVLTWVFVLGTVFLVSLLPIFRTFADASIFKVADANISFVSTDAEANISSFDDSTIYSKVVFHHINDEVVYDIKIQNSDSKDRLIESITDDNSSPYISYIYDSHQNFTVSAGEIFDFHVTAKYTTGVESINDRVFTSTVKFFINFDGEEEAIDIEPKAPDTGVNLISTNGGSLKSNLVIIVISSLGLIGCAIYASLKHKKYAKYIIAFAVAASIVTIPTVVSAVTTEVNVFTITTEYHLMDKLVIHNGDEDIIIDYGEPLDDVEEITDPEKPGHEFVGWEDEDGNPIDPDEPIKEDTTIIPRYVVNQYTITFDTAGGNEIAPITQDYGTNVTAPANPTRSGYTFAGWTPEIPATMPAENITVTANWTINQYTITFDTAGGSEIAPITQNYGTDVAAPANPTRTGYTFAGWTPEIPATMPAENMTVVAQWNINQYTITFDTAGGSEIAPITQNYGTDVTAPANPTRSGYTFAGWTPEIPTTMPAENMTVVAQWNINQYTITFDTAGGNEIASITQNYGTDVTAPANPTRTGYTFAGWTPEIPATMPAENITITANWTINQYTITFDTAGGSEVAPITQDYDTNVTAPTDPTRTGYTFAGWTPEIPTTMPAENMTITAQWDTNQITVHFDKNNGDATGTMDDLVFNYDEEKSLPNNGFVLEHYHFASWNTEADGSGTTYANEASVKNINTGGTTTLYAQWEADSYTITFDKNSNDATGDMANQVVTYGEPATLNTNAFTRTNYAFTGWNTNADGSGSSYEDSQDITNLITENVTLYAQWAVTPYTIIFDKNSEEATGEMANQSVPYGETINLTANTFSRASYYFYGWNTASDGSGTAYVDKASIKNLAVDGEIILYAQWVECPGGYVCYKPNGATANGTTASPSMSNQAISPTANSIKLIPSNFKNPIKGDNNKKAGFAGWNTKADGSGTSYGPNETVAITTGQYAQKGLALYAMWVESTGDLQGWDGCSTLNAGNVIALTDTRDNNTYAVAKLADGNCWMIENLRLSNKDDSDNMAILSASNTNNPSLPLTNIDDTTSNMLSPSQDISVDPWCTDRSAGCNSVSRVYTGNTTDSIANASSLNSNIYSYGNYYNWYSAMAGNYTSAGDICPAGWHLPYGGSGTGEKGGNTSGGFYYLGDQLGVIDSSAASNTLRSYPNNFVLAGSLWGSSVTNRGGNAFYSTNTPTAVMIYSLRDTGTNVNFAGNNERQSGLTVRCVTSVTTISYDKNAADATGEMTKQEVWPSVATNLVTNAFTRDHYAFSGWNTAPDGSGTAYADGDPITIGGTGPITLYAQWAVTPYTIIFDKNAEDATGEMANQSVPYGQTVNLTGNTYSRESADFVGWNTKADGTGTTYANEAAIKNLAVSGEITLYAQWKGFINYQPNASGVDGTMGHQPVNDGADVTLLASNFSHTGYGFAGWNTKSDYSGTFYGPQETITAPVGASKNGITLYAVWVASAGSLQDTATVGSICNSLVAAPTDGTANLSSVSALTDSRDNNTYAIAKLADGKCWMIENLRLEAENTRTSEKQALAQGYGGQFIGLADAEPAWANNTTAANSLYYSDTQEGTASVDIGATDAGYRFPRYNHDNTNSRASNPTINNAAMYSYGNYYTWAAVIADTDAHTVNNQIIANTSICPSGWHLPTGGGAYASDSITGVNVTGNPSTYREFYNLGYKIMDEVRTAYEDTPNTYQSYYSSATTNTAGDTAAQAFRKYPNNFIYSGAIFNSLVNDRGNSGSYWSSATYDRRYVYIMNFNAARVITGTVNSNKYGGMPARCVASSALVSFNKNATDATGEMAAQELLPGVATNLTANTFAREHYAFSGWNTAPDGSGTAYDDEASITVDNASPITLYAQWAVTPYTIVFDKNAADASGEMSNQSIPYGETVNLAANSYTRVSSNFVGWNTKADGSGTTYADGVAVKNLTVSGEITLYAQWTGFINYSTNASGVEGTMGHQSVSDGMNVTLLASNFSRNGYGFAGWNTEPDYSGTFYGPQETITAPAGASKNGIALYAIWVESAGSFQNTAEATSVCNSLVTAPTDGTADLRSVSALTDQRDNETYAIAKLADSKCWMIENLRLDNTAIGNTDGSLAQGYATSVEYGNFSGLADPEEPWTTPATPEVYTAANSLYSIDGVNNTINIGTTNATNRFPRYNNRNTAARSTNTTNTQNIYSYGNYYTWSAATANTTTEYSTTTSICPNGWQLPLGGTSTGNIEQGENDPANHVGGFSYLDRKIGGTGSYQSNVESSLRWRKYPNNYVLGGIVSKGGITLRGSGSSWWTSTGVNDFQARGLSLSATGIYPGTFNYGKVEGRNIRCIIGS